MVLKQSATAPVIFFCLCVACLPEGVSFGASPQPGAITLPPGFRIAVYAGDVPARGRWPSAPKAPCSWAAVERERSMLSSTGMGMASPIR